MVDWLSSVDISYRKTEQTASGSFLFPETNASLKHQGRAMLGLAGNSRSHLFSFPPPRECAIYISHRNYFTLSKQNSEKSTVY